eukprot:358344-Chlamydomonas_euryale.AAC.3
MVGLLNRLATNGVHFGFPFPSTLLRRGIAACHDAAASCCTATARNMLRAACTEALGASGDGLSGAVDKGRALLKRVDTCQPRRARRSPQNAFQPRRARAVERTRSILAQNAGRRLPQVEAVAPKLCPPL